MAVAQVLGDNSSFRFLFSDYAEFFILFYFFFSNFGQLSLKISLCLNTRVKLQYFQFN